MKRKVPLLLILMVLIASTAAFLLFYYEESLFFLFVGIFVLVAGIVTIGILQTLDLVRQDKMIDYEMVQKLNLHLVSCPSCEKENILEDQYCRYCGEQLKGEQDV